jgi:hypothetical protein
VGGESDGGACGGAEGGGSEIERESGECFVPRALSDLRIGSQSLRTGLTCGAPAVLDLEVE